MFDCALADGFPAHLSGSELVVALRFLMAVLLEELGSVRLSCSEPIVRQQLAGPSSAVVAVAFAVAVKAVSLLAPAMSRTLFPHGCCPGWRPLLSRTRPP
jgi:hypothetical protein